MNCIKCSQELADGVKFCRFCGQNQGMPVENPPVTAPISQTPYQAPVNPIQAPVEKKNPLQGIFSNGKGVPLLAVTAVGIVLVMAVGSGVFRSDSAKVAMAFAKTSSQLTKEMEEIRDDLPLYDFFKDVEKDQYQMEYHSTSPYQPSILMQMDYGKKQTRATAWTDDISFDVHISEKYTTMASSILPEVYGFDNKTLGKDLNNSIFVDFAVNDDYAFEPYKFEPELGDALGDVFADFVKELVTKADVEKIDKETYRINGSREDLDSYQVSISPTVLENAMESAVEEMLKDKSIMAQLMQGYAMGMSSEFNWIEDELSDIEGEIEDMLYDFVDKFVNEYRYLDENQLIVQLFKGKLVRIATPGRSGENVSVMFQSTDNFLEGIQVESYGWVENYSFSTDGDRFIGESTNEYGTTFRVVYDYEGTHNNLTVSDNRNSESLTLNTTGKNSLILTLDGQTVTFHKNQLPSGWFDQNTKFQRVLEYNESQVEALVDSLF